MASVLVALLGVLALPAAIVVSRESRRVHLIDAGWALPVAGALGILAIVLAARARRHAAWTVSGDGTAAARVGRALGVLAVCIAVAGAIAIVYYEYLRRVH
jgi:hypothetical protein